MNKEKRVFNYHLNLNKKIYVLRVDNLKNFDKHIYFFEQTLIVAFISANIFINVLDKYEDLFDLFLNNKTLWTQRNDRWGNQIDKWWTISLFTFDRLSAIKFKMLKYYFKINLANSCLQAFKSPVKALTVFIKKLYKNFHLFINCLSLNHLIIKKVFTFLFIGIFLN